MANYGSDFIDLIASGDEEKIKCVLLPTLGGAAAGGMLGSATVIGAPAGVVLGALGSYAGAYSLCGAGSTRGSIQRVFSSNRLPTTVVEDFESEVIERYGLDEKEARTLTKMAVIQLRQQPEVSLTAQFPEATPGTRNSLRELLSRGNAAGV